MKEGAVKKCISGIVKALGLEAAQPGNQPDEAAGVNQPDDGPVDPLEDLGLLNELEPCRVCHEDCAYLETEGDWCLYAVCGNCGSTTAFCAYQNFEEKQQAARKAIHLWNMGKVIAERRGE